MKHFISFSQEKNKAGDLLGDTEKTTTDKKRERRKKKKLKHLKIQEREKRQKDKEVMKGGDKKKSKAEVEQTLKKLTKGGKAKILTVSNEVKCSINEYNSMIVVLFRCIMFFSLLYILTE